MLDDGVLGFGEDGDEIFDGEVVAVGDAVEAANEFGDEAKLDEVFGLDFGEEVVGLLGVKGLPFGGVEADGALAEAFSDDFVEVDEGAPDDEEDVTGIDVDVLLVGVFAASLRRDVGDGAFDDLEEGLLDALTGDVAGDGDVAGGFADLVDLVDVDDARLSAGDVVVGGLDEA